MTVDPARPGLIRNLLRRARPAARPAAAPQGPTLLRIDAGARAEGSHSRRLADRVETALRAAEPGLRTTRRDLAAEPIGQIRDETIAGFYTPEADRTPALRRALRTSDALIAELRSAEILLIAAPLYNFSVPSALKAWIDQVVRLHETFAYRDGAFEGLVPGRLAVIAAAYGAEGYGPDGPYREMNFLEPYLERLMGFLGFDEVRAFRVEGTTGDAARIDAAHAAAERAILDAFPPSVAA